MSEGRLPEIIIQTQELEKSFQVGDRKFRVLRKINFKISEGEFLIIYGPSGSGKSTLLNCLIGLEPSSAGTIWVGDKRLEGLDSDHLAALRNDFYGVVYQQQIWVKSLSILENVALPLMIGGQSRHSALRHAQARLHEVGMERYASRRPTEISGGEQQRVGLARALVNNPRVLVLDEPTGNLDTHSADEVLLLLQRLNRSKHITVIMVTHNLAYLPLASMTLRLRDGAVEKQERPENLLSEEIQGIAPRIANESPGPIAPAQEGKKKKVKPKTKPRATAKARAKDKR